MGRVVAGVTPTSSCIEPEMGGPSPIGPPRLHRSSTKAPWERGLEFGATCGDLVRHTISAYQELFAADGLPTEVPEKAGRDVEEWLRANHPDLAIEIRGIAQGAGVRVADLMAVNARTELRSSASPECSVLAIGCHLASGSMVAQNWDYHPSLAASRVVWHVQHDHGWFVTFTEAGIVGKIGLNHAGLSVCLNGLRTDRDGLGLASPIHVLLRRLLQDTTSLAEAESLIRSTSTTASAALTIVHARGSKVDAAIFEISPFGVRSILPMDGCLAHTNHFLLPPTQGVDVVPRQWPDSHGRYDAVLVALAAMSGASSLEGLRAILSGHQDGPRSICTHAGGELEFSSRCETLTSIAMIPRARRFFVTNGPPCKFDYYEVPGLESEADGDSTTQAVDS